MLYASLNLCLLEQMSDCFNRMMQYHAWPREPHHLSDLLSHILAVAVSGALLAGGLLFSISAGR